MKILNQAKIYIDDYFYYIYIHVIEMTDCGSYSNIGRNHWRFGIIMIASYFFIFI